MRSTRARRRFAAFLLAALLLACGPASRHAAEAPTVSAKAPPSTGGTAPSPGGAATSGGAAAAMREAKKEITGYGPFDFARTPTAQEVEAAGGGRLLAISAGEHYLFTPYERFDGVVDFLQYYRKGKVPPARRSGPPLTTNAVEVRLKDGRLWLILLYFNPNDYDEYLRVIDSEYGEPAIASKKGTGALRKDVWRRGGRCITLEQVVLSNTMNGGHLAVQKDQCEETVRGK